MHHAETKPLLEAIDEKQPILQSSKWAYFLTRSYTNLLTSTTSHFWWNFTYQPSTHQIFTEVLSLYMG